MKPRQRSTSDGLAIMGRRYFQGQPTRLRALAEATLNAQIAQGIYALRTKAGLTQKQRAELVKTTDSVISRLEDADYAAHSLKMLHGSARRSTAASRSTLSGCEGGGRA